MELAIAAVGYAVTEYATYLGASAFVSAIAGAAATYALTAATAETQKFQGPKLGDLTVTGSSYGAVLPIIEGHPRLGGQVVWSSEKREIATTTEEGGKGGGGSQVTNFTYEVDQLIVFTGCEAAAVLRIFFGGDLVYTVKEGTDASSIINSELPPQWDRMTFYDGNPDQLPDPDYEAAVGAANAPAYRGRASIFFKGIKLGQSGNLPNITAEIARSVNSGEVVGLMLEHVSGVDNSPAQYIVDVANGDGDDWYDTSIKKFGTSALKPGKYVGDYLDNGAGGYLPSTLARMRRQFPPVIATFDEAINFHIDGWIYVSAHGGGPKFITGLGNYAQLWMDDEGHLYPVLYRSSVGTFWKDPLTSTGGAVFADIGDSNYPTPNQFPFHGGELTVANQTSTGNEQKPHVSINPNIVPLDQWVHVSMFRYEGRHFTQVGNAFGIHEHGFPNLPWNGIYTGFPAADLYHTAGTLPFQEPVRTGNSWGWWMYPMSRPSSKEAERLFVIDNNGDPKVSFDVGSQGISDDIRFDAFRLAHDAIFISTSTSFGGYSDAAPTKDEFTVSLYPFDIIEPLASNDPTVSEVVTRLCLAAGLEASQFSAPPVGALAARVHGLVIGQPSSARSVIEILMGCYFFDCVLSDKIYFISRAGATVETLAYDELGWAPGEPLANPLPLRLGNELELPAQLALTYNNIDGDYQTDTQYSDRIVTGQRSTEVVQVPLGLTASEAKIIADARLLEAYVALLTSQIALSLEHAGLEPTDPVLVTAKDGSSYRMRLLRRTDADCVLAYETVLDDATVFQQLGLTVGGTGSQTTILPLPNTEMELLDIPLLRDEDDRPGIYVAVKGDAPNWHRATVFHSTDDVTYVMDADISSEAVFGKCMSALNPWTGGTVFDEMSSVIVNVEDGTLSSVTKSDVLNSTSMNAALIGNEIVQFHTATLQETGIYKLTGFIRGRRGTEWAMTGHAANERFVKLGVSGMRFLPLEASDLGSNRFYKAVTAGKRLSGVRSEDITPLGVNLEPFSPVLARADRDTADTVIRWNRRTRLSTRVGGPLPPAIPLGEATEAYEIDVFDDDTFSLVVRTLTSSTESVTYSSTAQVADFGSTQSELYLRIYQLSQSVGRGYPLQATV